MFRRIETVAVQGSRLQQPCLGQSNEPFEFGGELWTTYQINDCEGGMNFFTQPGEVWLSTLLTSPQKQWLLESSGSRVITEPEPVVGRDSAWVFYTSYPAGNWPWLACPAMQRANVPTPP